MYVIIRRHLDGPNAILILRIKMILDDGDCTLRITVVDSINNTTAVAYSTKQ